MKSRESKKPGCRLQYPRVLFDVPVSDSFTVVYYLFEAFVNTDSELMIAVTMT